MGIEAFSLQMLCNAKQQGAAFANTLTLGRQDLSLHRRDLDSILRSVNRSRTDLDRRGVTELRIADELLIELLDITRLVSMDCSGYEGATMVHDLNLPVPAEIRDTFDAVIDTGTLEHVFNFPVAIANCMNMLRVGGRFYALSPANNHCGHGFYQFSPELFFRLFTSDNGFAIEHVIAVQHPFPGIELSRARTAYAVRDPALLSQRVNLTNDRPVYLFVQAVKQATVEPFSTAPQQSDYAVAWQAQRNRSGEAVRRPSLGTQLALQIWRLHAAMPLAIRRPLLGMFQRWYGHTFRNRRAYRKWDQQGPPPFV